MDFTGFFFIARSDRPLSAWPSLATVGGRPCWSAHGDGGWQVLKVSGVDDTADLYVQEAGAPTLVATVLDSALAMVEAGSPGGRYWATVLSPKEALDSGFPPETITDPQVVADTAVLWAQEAGLEPDRAAVVAALTAERDPDAEDLVLQLASALGFRFGDGVDLPDWRSE